MSEQAQTEPWCGESGGGGPWYPVRKWWWSGGVLHQDVGMPPVLEPRDARWVNADRLQRGLGAWPGYTPAPLFVPYVSGSVHPPGQEVSPEPYRWRVSLDLAHFSPSEISLSVKDGFLVVGGRHEERRDEHGFIARCFTRKYRLPGEIDATKICSTLSIDGILSVDAPVPEASVPTACFIPIKLETEATRAQEEPGEREETPETEENACRAGNPEFPSAEDDGEQSPPEVRGDEAQPDTAGLQQHGERKEQEDEVQEELAGESRPPAAAAGDGAESPQDSSEQREAPESHEGPDPDTSKPPEDKGTAGDGEIQAAVSSAEEIVQPEEPELGKSPAGEVPSQELDPPDIKPEHTE